MTAAEALAAYKNNAADVAHLIQHLGDLFEGFMEEFRDGRFDPAKAEIVRNVRDRLIRTLEAVGITRLETLEALDEQRKLFDDVTESDEVVVEAV